MGELNPILIIHCPLSTNKDEVLKVASTDEKLVASITEVRKVYASQDLETFEQIDNIIVTELGYYLAFYENDLKKIE